MDRLRQAAIGISAALRTPFWLHDRLGQLLDGRSPTAVGVADAGDALRFANATLRILARLPPLPYRNTCLYRSVAECLVLLRVGIPCRLQIGVRRNGAAQEELEAHAWVERDGEATTDPLLVRLRRGP